MSAKFLVVASIHRFRRVQVVCAAPSPRCAEHHNAPVPNPSSETSKGLRLRVASIRVLQFMRQVGRTGAMRIFHVPPLFGAPVGQGTRHGRCIECLLELSSTLNPEESPCRRNVLGRFGCACSRSAVLWSPAKGLRFLRRPLQAGEPRRKKSRPTHPFRCLPGGPSRPTPSRPNQRSLPWKRHP